MIQRSSESVNPTHYKSSSGDPMKTPSKRTAFITLGKWVLSMHFSWLESRTGIYPTISGEAAARSQEESQSPACICQSFLPWESRRRDVYVSRERDLISQRNSMNFALHHPAPSTAHVTWCREAQRALYGTLGTLYLTSTSWDAGTWVPCTRSTLCRCHTPCTASVALLSPPLTSL